MEYRNMDKQLYIANDPYTSCTNIKSNQSNQIKFICDKNKHDVTHTQKNKASMPTGHKGSMKLH